MGSVLGLLLKIRHHGIHGIRKEHSNSLPQLPERKSVSLTTLEASLPMALSSGKVENRLTLATDCLLTGYKKIFFSYWQLHSGKDTVFITFRVSGWSWHIQQNQFCFVGLVNYDFIKLHCCMHPSHIGVVPEWGRNKVVKANRKPVVSTLCFDA